MISTLFDVMLGMIYIYTFFSLLCSTILEWLAQVLRLRARVLRDSIPKLLGSPAEGGVAQEIHQHPLIQGIELRPPYPTYISPKQFTLALIDVAVDVRAAGSPPIAVRENTRGGVALTPHETSLVRSLLGDGMSLQMAQNNIEKWFEDSMERVAGAYKRRVSRYLFGIALAVCFGFGLDTLQVVQSLYANQPLRQAIVTAAQSESKTGSVTVPNFPVAGPKSPLKDTTYALGCLLTAVLLSLGAPLWFDLLGKLTNLRQTGVPPDMKGKIVAQ